MLSKLFLNFLQIKLHWVFKCWKIYKKHKGQNIALKTLFCIAFQVFTTTDFDGKTNFNCSSEILYLRKMSLVSLTSNKNNYWHNNTLFMNHWVSVTMLKCHWWNECCFCHGALLTWKSVSWEKMSTETEFIVCQQWVLR